MRYYIINLVEKNLAIPKGLPEAVNQRKTDKSMAKRKSLKGQKDKHRSTKHSTEN